MPDERVPVLIVGAGYAGLAAAVSLAWRGIPALLVERRPGTSTRPKAYGLNNRAMELLRQALGLEGALRERARAFHRLVERSTAACVPPVPLPDPDRPTGDLARLTPVAELSLHQSDVERVLRAKAEELGSDLRFATELTAFEQDPGGVTATVRDASGAARTVRARYLVAADGHDSPIRAALGISTRGEGTLARMHGVAFTADLPDIASDADLYYLLNRDPVVAVAARTTRVETDSYFLRLTFPPDGDAEPSGERYAELIRAATGNPGMDVRVIDHSAFPVGHALAERFALGRVFLAGDAAHVMPPSGGQSASTAVHDGWDLGWRLALVLTGQAGTAFLDSYDAERRPACRLIADAQLASWFARTEGRAAAPIDRADLMFGHCYRSNAIIPAIEEPSGRPGSRAAHVAVVRDGALVSTLDLFGARFVLLAGPNGGAWAPAARQAARRLGVDLAVHLIGADIGDPTGTWCARYGVETDGASLVRPDGHVAWRSPNAATRELHVALSRILARDG